MSLIIIPISDQQLQIDQDAISNHPVFGRLCDSGTYFQIEHSNGAEQITEDFLSKISQSGISSGAGAVIPSDLKTDIFHLEKTFTVDEFQTDLLLPVMDQAALDHTVCILVEGECIGNIFVVFCSDVLPIMGGLGTVQVHDLLETWHHILGVPLNLGRFLFEEISMDQTAEDERLMERLVQLYGE